MRLLLLLWLATMAAAILGGTLLGGVTMQFSGGYPGGRSGMIDTIGGLLSTVAWAVVALGAQNITQVSNGTVVTTQNDAFSFIAVALAALSLVVTVGGVSVLIDVRDVTLDG